MIIRIKDFDLVDLDTLFTLGDKVGIHNITHKDDIKKNIITVNNWFLINIVNNKFQVQDGIHRFNAIKELYQEGRLEKFDFNLKVIK